MNNQSTSVVVLGNLPANDYTKMDDSDMPSLCKVITQTNIVRLIDLSFNNIGDDGISILVGCIQNSQVGSLNLQGNDIGTVGATTLADLLKSNAHLKVLNLKANKIGRKGGLEIAKSLRVNSTLEELDIGETDQEMESLIAFAIVLSSSNSLKKLNVSRPLLFTHEEESTIHFSDMLKINSSLTEIHLAKMNIKDLGAMWLANSLVHNKTLRLLDLSCNEITCDGAYDVARILKENDTLEILDLSCNDLKDEGSLAIADALLSQTSLHTLSMTNNSIRDRGLCGLAEGIMFNGTLKYLYIWGNHVGDDAAETLASLTLTGRLKTENVDYTPYVVDDVTYLAWNCSKPNEFTI